MPKNMKNKKILLLLTALFTGFLALPSAQAASGTFDGGAAGTSSAWLTATNWTGDVLVGSTGTGAAALTNSDIATFANVTTIATIGINFNTATNNQLNLGAIQNTGTVNRTIGDSSTIAGVLRLNGATISGTSNVILRNSGSNSLTLQNNGGNAGTVTIALGNGTDNIALLDGVNGNITVSSNITQVSGTVAKLTLGGVGSGLLTLSGSNSYTGGTVVSNSSGTLIVGSVNALGSGSNALTVNAGTVDLQGRNISVGALSGSNTGIIRSGSAGVSTFTVGSGYAGASTYDGTIVNGAGTVALTKAGSGTLTLTNINTYSGTTTVGAGKLALSGSGSIGSGAVSIGDTATLDVSGIAGSSYSISSQVSTSGTGNLVTTGKTVTLSGNVTPGGSGTVGGLNVTGGITLSGTATFDITGITTGLYDTIVASGAVNFSSINIVLTNSFTPSTTGTVQLFTAGSFTGSIISITGTAVSGGYYWDTSSLATTGAITLVAPASSPIYTWGVSGTGGSGSWNGVSTNWYDPNGATNVVWDSSKGALFAGTAGTVTVSGAQGVGNGIEFSTSGYLVTSGTVGLNGSSAAFNTITVDSGSATIASVLSGSTGMTKAGSGSLILSGANIYTGTTFITAGTLSYGANDVLADTSVVNVNGGVYDIGGFRDTVGGVSLLSGSITGSGTLTSATTYDVQSGTVSAVLAGTAGLTKSTGGTVLLSGNNSYSGTTTLSGGLLQAGSNTAFGTSVLALNSGTLSSSDVTNRTFANAVTVGGDVGLGAASTGTLTLSGGLDLSGTTRTLTIGSGVVLSGTYGNGAITKAGTGSLEFANSGTLTGLTVSSGTATIDSGNTVTLTGTQLSAAGGTTLINGTLLSKSTATWGALVGGVTVGSTGTVIQQGTGSPTSFVFSASWAPGSSLILRDYTTAPAVSNRTYAMNLTFDSSGASVNAGGISGSGAWTVNGDLTIGDHVAFSYGTYSGSSSFLGNVMVSGTLGTVANTTGTGARSFTIGSGKSLTINSNGVVNLQSGAVATIASGATLKGTGAIHGGSVNVSGTLAPGASPGLLTVDTLVLNSTASSLMEISGTTRADATHFGLGSGAYDAVDVTTFTLDGTIVLTLTEGYSPVLGDTFDLFNWSTIVDNWTGSVDSHFDLSQAALGSGLSWDLSNFTTNGSITVIPEPSTCILLGLGATSLLFFQRRKRC